MKSTVVRVPPGNQARVIRQAAVNTMRAKSLSDILKRGGAHTCGRIDLPQADRESVSLPVLWSLHASCGFTGRHGRRIFWRCGCLCGGLRHSRRGPGRFLDQQGQQVLIRSLVQSKFHRLFEAQDDHCLPAACRFEVELCKLREARARGPVARRRRQR